MKNISFVITNDNVNVIVDGESVTVRKGAPNFVALRQALVDGDEDAVYANLTTTKSLMEWVQGRFTVQGDTVLHDGQPLPGALNRRIVDMAARGEDPQPLFKFYERLQLNPSHRSVTQLWDFLNHVGIPLTADGCFLAYKGVKEDFRDCHSGTFDNSPGQTHEMSRNQISDDPEQPCHVGFHVGALEYARGFGPRVVICKVAPEDVVCVPKDYSFQKMRVCKYVVEGHHNGALLSSTVHEDEADFSDDDCANCAGTGSYFDDEVGDDVDCDECGGCGVVPAEKDEETSPGDALTITQTEDEADGTRTTTTIKVPKRFAKYQNMSMSELLELSLDSLRQYAGKGLKITGASKIPGGKVSLVTRILGVRGK